MGRRERTVLLVILTVVALALRIGHVLTVDVDNPLRADAGQYFTCAKNLVEHATFSTETGAAPRPDSFRSPGYPGFLALVLATVGRDRFYLVALLAQAVLGALLVPLTYRLARSCTPPGFALVAAGLSAVSPHLVTSCGYLLSEALTAPLLVATLATLAAWRRRCSAARTLGAGILMVLLYFVQEATLGLPFVLVALLARRLEWRRKAFALLAVFLVGAGAWQARSALVVPEGAATAGQRVVATLSHGSYPQLFFATEANRYFPYREDPEQPEFGRTWSRFASVLGSRIAAEPLRYLKWYVLEKPVWLWSWGIVQGQGDVFVYPVRTSLFERVAVVDFVRTVMHWLHPLCVVLMLIAVLLRKAPLPIVVTLVWFTLLHSLFLPDPRYLVPLKPLLFVTASVGVGAVLARFGWFGNRLPAPHAG